MLTPLTTRSVALVLGISEASLKRWCDRGLLPASRTVGGHRRLPVHGVVDFVRTHGLPMARPELLGLPAAAGRGAAVVERVRDDLRRALIAGEDETFRRLAFDPWLAGESLHDVLERGVVPALAALGEDVLHGSAEIYQERRAVEIVHRFLHEVRALLRPPAADAPLAIGGAAEGDPYVLPTAVVELCLRAAGWRTQSLGVDLPLRTLRASLLDERPDLFWMSVSAVPDRERLVTGWNALHAQALGQGVRTVVGGRGLDPGLRARLGASLRPAGLAELAGLPPSRAAVGSFG